MSKRRYAVVAAVSAGFLLLGSGVAFAGSMTVTTPTCTARFYNSASLDYAWNSGTCTGTQVRHQYVTSSTHWTGWYSSGSGTYVRTPTAAQLSRSEHKVVILGDWYTYGVIP